jgi:hypothetical protein
MLAAILSPLRFARLCALRYLRFAPVLMARKEKETAASSTFDAAREYTAITVEAYPTVHAITYFSAVSVRELPDCATQNRHRAMFAFFGLGSAQLWDFPRLI